MHFKKRTYIIAAAVFVFIIGQFAIPSDTVMPRTKLSSQEIGWQKTATLEAELNKKAQNVTLIIDGKKTNYAAKDVGVYLNTESTIEQLPTVEMKDRLIPFKPLYLLIRPVEVQVQVKKDEARIKAFANKLSLDLKREPVDAKPVIADAKITIVKDKAGLNYSSEKIRLSLLKNDLFNADPLVLESTKVSAKIQEKDVLPLKNVFTEKTTQTLTVKFGESTKTIAPDELKTMMVAQQNPETGNYNLALSPEAVTVKIDQWAQEYNRAPGITQISYYDDVETSRNTGPSGRALNADEIRKQLQTWYDQPTTEPVALATNVLAPRIVASRTYSRSSAQLQAKLDAWVASHSGRYQIAIRELNGRGREASHNVSQQTVMASTYKPFLAFVAYKMAESGEINLNTKLPKAGITIEKCIEIMIIISDNNCAIELGRNEPDANGNRNLVGWARADQVIAAAGFVGVTINNYDSAGNIRGDKLVNAREQAKFLAQLSGGSLINQQNTNKLIDYMKRQSYSRAGIPAGSRGAPVANKVGVLFNYVHDVGIVYGPKSTYALVIMSEGSSYTNIRNLSEAVYDFMNE